MEVRFWHFSKKVNSTAQPQTNPRLTVNCQLKEPSGVLNPTLIVKSSEWSDMDYAYCVPWNRYYFISDVTFMNGNRLEVSLTCDFLATFKASIQNYTCFVERSASNYNANFDDSLVSNAEELTYKDYKTSNLGTGFSGSGCYVIQCVGGGKSGTGITTYVTNEAGMQSFLNALFDTTKYGFLADEVVKSFFNPFQYVVSVKWMPVSFRSLVGAVGSEKTANMICGWFDTGQIGYLLGADGVTATSSITVPNNPYTDFRRYSPRFSQYSMFLPAVGTIHLNPIDVQGGLTCTLTIDALTGYAQYWINSGSNLVGTYKTQMGVPIQIGQLNSGFLNMAASGTSAIVSAAAGNIAGAGTSLVDAVKSTLNPTMSINGVNGDKYTFSENLQVGISLICRESGDIPTTQAGRPCYKNLRLGSLSGFVKCGNASITLGHYAYEEDKNQVNSYLNNGFYME